MIQWTQRDELNFLDSIGSHSNALQRMTSRHTRRRSLLRGYVAALDLPREWFPNSAPETLRAHAVGLIEDSYKLERKQHNKENECRLPNPMA